MDGFTHSFIHSSNIYCTLMTHQFVAGSQGSNGESDGPVPAHMETTVHWEAGVPTSQEVTTQGATGAG